MTGEEAALPTVRLHGRAPQLSRIRTWWHQPPAHRAALLVAGEPGLGRTAVLRWAAGVLGAGSTGHLVAGVERGGGALEDLVDESDVGGGGPAFEDLPVLAP
ncbi:hypothetical protein AB0948_27465, partial [Streptomyces koyangensis]|uniref:hypothetical protein n=1 Tax=Streptomyces koyangensis TaxID=188770 RepID=UPI00345118F2